MIRRLAILWVMLAASLVARADESLLFDAAAVSGAWLGIPRDARTLGMAESTLAVSAGLAGLYGNPAGLGFFRGQRIEATHNAWFQSIATEHLAWGMQAGKGGFAASIDYLNFGEVGRYTLDAQGIPQPDGSFTPSAFLISAGYGLRLPNRLVLGASLKALGETLVDTSDVTVGGDIGLLWSPPMRGTRLGLAVRDLSGPVSGGSTSYNIVLGGSWGKKVGPWKRRTIRGRVGKVRRDLVGFSATVQIPPRAMGTTRIGLGAEYRLAGRTAFRVGYKFIDTGSLRGLKGLAGGLGYRYQAYEIHYGVASFGDLGLSHQVSFGYRF